MVQPARDRAPSIGILGGVKGSHATVPRALWDSENVSWAAQVREGGTWTRREYTTSDDIHSNGHLKKFPIRSVPSDPMNVATKDETATRSKMR